MVVRIHAKAVKAGAHVFRAEVACQDLEIRLAAEEMTRFYTDEAGGSAILRSASKPDPFSQPR